MDIKVDNILLDENFNAKVADLGTSCLTNNGATTRRCGTKQYMAPEIMEGDKNSSFDAFKSDAYSLGVTIYVMLTGQFPNTNESTTLTNDSSSKFNVSDSDEKENILLSEVSDECRDFLNCLLCSDPSKRSSVIEVLDHPWISNLEGCIPSSEIFLEMKAREDYIVGQFSSSS